VAKLADLLSVDDARTRILARFGRLSEELVPLEDALRRVLARSVEARGFLPPFANSSMDGFALLSALTRSATHEAPVALRVRTTIPAGSGEPTAIDREEAARIMTGAPVPDGADAIIPFEDVDDLGDSILIRSEVREGACVRPAGQDVVPGESVLPAGLEIRAAQIGMLAALGIDQVWCVRRPEIAIVATGDELVPPGNELRRGQIYNSNVPMLAASVEEAGGRPSMLSTIKDDPGAIAQALEAAFGSDLILTSGGASVGDFDHVRAAMGVGGDIGFWRVRVRPGKPLIFGSIGDTPLIGLPGNPTSAMVTFQVFARPAIRVMLGQSPLEPEIEAVVDETIENRGGRQTYARVRLRLESGRFHASLSGPQDSAMLLPLSRADGLLVVPEDVDEMKPGDVGRVLVWRLPG
jgi:molybdopterin molybdotransferase